MEENLKQSLYLGLDTSAYTTSLALVDRDEKLILDKRLPLPVKKGSLGMRQSEAVFAHIANMPKLWEEGTGNLKDSVISAVASATRPRPVEGSYMPVFRVSEAFGSFLAQTAGLLFLPSSHQEGHVMAGLWSAGLSGGRYLVIHISGGTTEFISANEEKEGQLELKLLGGSSDLNAGQFIDRLGMAMGLNFPAGPQLEAMAAGCREGGPSLPIATKGTQISFSGPASHAERLLKQGCGDADLARAVETCIADSIAEVANRIIRGNNTFEGVLAVGGVTSNLFIRERLIEKITGKKLYFARPEYASDNAVGLAVQVARFYKNTWQSG